MYESNDLAELQPLLDAEFTPHDTEIVDRRPLKARFEGVHRGNIAMDDLTYGTAVTTRPLHPPGYYAIRVGRSGGASLTCDGHTTRFAPAIVSPGQELTIRWGADTRIRILRVSKAMVDDTVRRELGYQPDRSIRFDTAPNCRDPEVVQWLGLVASFSSMVDSRGLLGGSLAVTHFEHLLVHTMVRMVGHNLSGAFHGRRGAAGPSSLRRAMAFCDENASRPITVAQIAEAAYVSTRTIHELFRSHLNTTPYAYLKRVRLAGAHADLVAIAEGRAVPRTVAHVGQAWGFPHASRFGQNYRAMYGRTPASTLHGRADTSDTATRIL